jgi:Cof subfamily protein (haloacid dehalogenase superfamily)
LEGVLELKYKLVAIDMDGTLLNSEKQISERTRKAIENAKMQGTHIVICTGRILNSALYYSESLDLKNPLIACNGAIIVDEDRNVIYEKALEREKIREISNLAKLENIYCHFYDKSNFYSNIRSDEVLKFYNEGNSEVNIGVNVFDNIEDIMKMEDLNVYKFIFIDNNRDKLNKLREKLDKLGNINTTSSWINNIEAMGLNVSKGEALKALCKKLNIEAEEVIAIGDSENDLSMLKFAGLGVAMKNGDKLIKEYADHITDSNDENGVAKVIEKFILK